MIVRKSAFDSSIRFCMNRKFSVQVSDDDWFSSKTKTMNSASRSCDFTDKHTTVIQSARESHHNLVDVSSSEIS